MKSYSQMNTRLNELNKEVEKLKSDISSIEELMSDEPLIAMAEELHSRLCRSNHDDGCSWYYESWEKPAYSKKRYLEMAKRVDRALREHGVGNRAMLISQLSEIVK